MPHKWTGLRVARGMGLSYSGAVDGMRPLATGFSRIPEGV